MCFSVFSSYFSNVAGNILIAFENAIRLSADALIVSVEAIRKPTAGPRMY